MDNSGDILSELIKYAHGNNTKILISVGGWSDSTYFSKCMLTVTSRTKFVTALSNLMDTYGADGIDIDWFVVSTINHPCPTRETDRLPTL
jgi:chitinase